MKLITKAIAIAVLVAAGATWAGRAGAVDLLEKYPTALTSGLLDPGQARPWQFTVADIYAVSRFKFEVGTKLKVETGAADVGIGHCRDGAICAMIIPQERGKLTRDEGSEGEQIAHIWLRFHPSQINKLFPPATVSAPGDRELLGQFRTIANAKFRSSFHAGMNAMIPDPKDLTVDIDTKAGTRRFFMVDTSAGKIEYVDAFVGQPVRIGGAGQAGSGGAEAAAKPRIVSTSPADGATDVDPGTKEITVTFDQDMGGGMSWTGGGPELPNSPAGARAHWQDRRTCVLPVTLEAGHHYRVGINSPSFRNFRSAAGEPAQPSSINFTTR